MTFIFNQPVSDGLLQLRQKLKEQRTYAERVLWQELRASRLDGVHFRQQQIIGGFIADFYCRKYQLVIELDGGVHDDRQTFDRVRDRMLKEAGLTVIRFKNEDIIRRLSWVLMEIRRAMASIQLDRDFDPSDL